MKEPGTPAPPMEITPEIAAKCNGADQFGKFDRLVRNVLAVPPKPKGQEKPHRKISKSTKNH